MHLAPPALVFAVGFSALSVLALVSEPAKAPLQPIGYSHEQHVGYFADGRHRAEMFRLHGFDHEEDAFEELRRGECLTCHEPFEREAAYIPRIRHCGRCHEVFLDRGASLPTHLRPCFGCHAGAASGPTATLPNIEQCAACHPRTPEGDLNPAALALYSQAAQDAPWRAGMPLVSPELALARYLADELQIPWVPVYDYLPGDIVFSHERHALLGGIDCERCHGPVREATRPLSLVLELTMEDCVSCHQETGASEDCLACHR
jgi:hypothetical protein